MSADAVILDQASGSSLWDYKAERTGSDIWQIVSVARWLFLDKSDTLQAQGSVW